MSIIYKQVPARGSSRHISQIAAMANRARARIGTWASNQAAIAGYVKDSKYYFCIFARDEDGTILGFVLGRQASPKIPYSKVYVIVSECAGVGSELLLEVPYKCKTLVSIRNKRSQACFAKAGFKRWQTVIVKGKEFYEYVRG